MNEAGTLAGGVEAVFTPHVVGVGEVVSWPEYRRVRFERPEPHVFTGVSTGERITFVVTVPAAQSGNRHARRRARRESRRAR